MAGASLSRSTGAELAPSRQGAGSPPLPAAPIVVASGVVLTEEDGSLPQPRAKDSPTVNSTFGNKRSRWSKLLGRRPGSGSEPVEREPVSILQRSQAPSPGTPTHSLPHWRRAAHAFGEEDQSERERESLGSDRAPPSAGLFGYGYVHPPAPPPQPSQSRILQPLPPPPRRRGSSSLTDSAKRRRRASAPQGTVDVFSPPVTIIQGGAWGTLPRQGAVIVAAPGTSSSRHARGRHAHSLGALQEFGLEEAFQGHAGGGAAVASSLAQAVPECSIEAGSSSGRRPQLDLDGPATPTSAAAIRPSSETRSSRHEGEADDWHLPAEPDSVPPSPTSASSSSASLPLSEGVGARLFGDGTVALMSGDDDSRSHERSPLSHQAVALGPGALVDPDPSQPANRRLDPREQAEGPDVGHGAPSLLQAQARSRLSGQGPASSGPGDGDEVTRRAQRASRGSLLDDPSEAKKQQALLQSLAVSPVSAPRLAGASDDASAAAPRSGTSPGLAASARPRPPANRIERDDEAGARSPSHHIRDPVEGHIYGTDGNVDHRRRRRPELSGQAAPPSPSRSRVLTPDAPRDTPSRLEPAGEALRQRLHAMGESASEPAEALGGGARAAATADPHAPRARASRVVAAPPPTQTHIQLEPSPASVLPPSHHHHHPSHSSSSATPLAVAAAQSGPSIVLTPLTSVRRTRQRPLSDDVRVPPRAAPVASPAAAPSASATPPSSPSLARRISAFAQRAVSPTFVQRRWSSTFSSNAAAGTTSANPLELSATTAVDTSDTARDRASQDKAKPLPLSVSSSGRRFTPRYPSSGPSRPGIPVELLADGTASTPSAPKKRRSRLLQGLSTTSTRKSGPSRDSLDPATSADRTDAQTKARSSFSPLARVTGLPEPEPELDYRSSAAAYRALLGPLPRQRSNPAFRALDSPTWEDVPPIPGSWDPSTAGPTSLPPPPRSPSGSVGRRRGQEARTASQLSILDLGPRHEPRQRSTSSHLDSETTPPLQQQSFSAVGEKLSLQDSRLARRTRDRSSEAAPTSTVRSYASAASALTDASKRLNREHAVGSFSGGVQPRYSPPRRGGSANSLFHKWSPSKRSPPRSLAERRPAQVETSSSRQPQLRSQGSVASSFALVDRPEDEENRGPHGRQASEPSTLPKPQPRSRKSGIPQPTSRRSRLLSFGSKKKEEQRRRQEEQQELEREGQQQQAVEPFAGKTAFPSSESNSGPFFGALSRLVPPRSRLSSLSQQRRGTKSHSSAIRPSEAEQAASSPSGLPTSSTGGLVSHPLVGSRLQAGPSNSSLRRTLSGGASAEIRARPFSHPAAVDLPADGRPGSGLHSFRRSIAEVPSSSATSAAPPAAHAPIAPPSGMPSVAETQPVASPAWPATRSLSLQGPEASSSLNSHALTARPRRGSSASRTSVANRSGLTRSGSKSEGLGAPSRSTILNHTHAPNASLVVQMDDRHGFLGLGAPETVREEENGNTSREEDQEAGAKAAAPTRAESNPKSSKLSTVRRIFRSRAKSDAASSSRNATVATPPPPSQSPALGSSTAPKLPAVAGLDEFGRLGPVASPMTASASAPGLAGRASNESHRRGKDSSFFGFRSREAKRSVDLRGVDFHPGPAKSEPSRLAARAGGVDAAPQRPGSRRERTAEEMYDDVAAEVAGRGGASGTVGSTGMRFLEEADALTPPLSPSKGESFLSASRPGSTTPSRAGFGSLRGNADRSLTLQALSASKGSRLGNQLREVNEQAAAKPASPATPSSLLARETLQSWQERADRSAQSDSQRNSDVPTVTGPEGSGDEPADEVGVALTAASAAPRGEQAVGIGSGDGNSSRARTTSLPTRPTVPRIWQVSRNSKVLSPTGELIDDEEEADEDEEGDGTPARALSPHARTGTMLSGTSVASYQTADSSLQPHATTSRGIGGTTLSTIDTSRDLGEPDRSREVISPLQELISSLEERHGTASNGTHARQGSSQLDDSISASNLRDMSVSDSHHSPYDNDSDARHREAARRKRNTFGGAESTPGRSVDRTSADESPSKLHFPSQPTPGGSVEASGGSYEVHSGRELTVSEIESNLAAVEAALHDASIQGSFDPSSLRRRLGQPGLAAGDTSLRSTVAANGSFADESMMAQGDRSSSGRVYLPPGSEFAIAHAVQQVRRAISSSHLPRIPSEDSNLIAEADGGKWQSTSREPSGAAAAGSPAVASPRPAAGAAASPLLSRGQQRESTPLRSARVRQESMQDVEQAYARMCELVGSAAGIIASPPSGGNSNRQSPWRRRSDQVVPPDQISPSLARIRTQSAAPAPASRHRSTMSEHRQLLRDSDAFTAIPATSPLAPVALPEEPELRGRPSNLSTNSRRAASESPRRNIPGDRLEELPDLKRNSNSHKRASIEPAMSTSGSGGGASNSPTVTAKTQGTPRSLDAEQAHRQLARSIDGWRTSHGGSSQDHAGSHRRQDSGGGVIEESAASSSRDPFGSQSIAGSAAGGTAGHRSRGSVGPGAPPFASIASPSASRRAPGSSRDWSGEISGRPTSRGSAIMRTGTMSRDGSEMGDRRPGSAFPIGSPVPSTLASMQRRHALERDSLLDSLERSRTENLELRANNQQLQDDLHQEVTRVLELERELERSRDRQSEMEARIMDLEEQLESEHRDRLRIAELLERVQKAVDTAAAERSMGFSPSASSASIVQEDLQPTSRRVFDIPSVLQPGPRPLTGDSNGRVSPPSMFAPERGGSSQMPPGEEAATPAQTAFGDGSFRSRSPSLHSIPSALGLDVRRHEMEWTLADEEPLEDISGAVADEEDVDSAVSNSPFRPRPPRFAQHREQGSSGTSAGASSPAAKRDRTDRRISLDALSSLPQPRSGSNAGISSRASSSGAMKRVSLPPSMSNRTVMATSQSVDGSAGGLVTSGAAASRVTPSTSTPANLASNGAGSYRILGKAGGSLPVSRFPSTSASAATASVDTKSVGLAERFGYRGPAASRQSSSASSAMGGNTATATPGNRQFSAASRFTATSGEYTAVSDSPVGSFIATFGAENERGGGYYDPRRPSGYDPLKLPQSPDLQDNSLG